MREITVHIEELIVDAALGDRRQIASAFEQELVGLLTLQAVSPLFWRSGTIEHLDAGSLPTTARHGAAAAGAAVARAVHMGLRR